MACLICGSQNASEKLFTYNEPDKYELWVGINKPRREWRRCGVCGVGYQYRNYKLSILNSIYASGYRDPGFRDETIAQAFDRIKKLPVQESENAQRLEWLNDVLPMIEGTLLDVGAGIGVFADSMRHEWKVSCVECNDYSIEFITKTLELPCSKTVEGIYDMVSAIHVLEHVSDPAQFLKQLRTHTDGYLFIEVPDAKEFNYLPQNHDEFNSCHEWFFTLPTLIQLIERCGFEVMDATRKYYPARELSRLMVVAQCV